MKTTNGFRVKMRKNDISEESNKKAIKLAPIKKNSKESKLFLNSKSKVEDEDEEVELNFKKQKSTLDYFDDGDEDIDDDDEIDIEEGEYDDNEEFDYIDEDEDEDIEDDDSEDDSVKEYKAR